MAILPKMWATALTSTITRDRNLEIQLNLHLQFTVNSLVCKKIRHYYSIFGCLKNAYVQGFFLLKIKKKKLNLNRNYF